jgi:hypothetical protein
MIAEEYKAMRLWPFLHFQTVSLRAFTMQEDSLALLISFNRDTLSRQASQEI